MGRKLTLVSNKDSRIKRKKIRNQLAKRRFLTLSFIVFGFCLLGFNVYSIRLEKLKEAENQLAEYEEQYLDLIEVEEYYRAEISKLENEDYIARLAREKYFKSEEGEILFKFPELLDVPNSK